ncbi:MAG: UDP-N-acetylglucosamine 2-epimerase (non-hydrolyzing), partial [Bacteroidia bacterium]
MKKILSVVGSQRSYIQIGPVAKALRKYRKEVKHLLYHAGMPIDQQTSTLLYEDLQLPRPDFFQETGEGSHVSLTARIMLEAEKL